MADLDVRVKRNTAPGEDYFNRQAQTMASEGREVMDPTSHPMDGDEARSELRKLLEWFYFEKEKQAANRLE